MEFQKNWTSEDYYNADDLNRVEQATLEVSEWIKNMLAVNVGIDPVVTDRDYSSIIYANDLNRVESNIEKLDVLDKLNLIDMKTNWQVADAFSYEDANRLEFNLSLLYPLFKVNSENLVYSGEFYAGEEVI